MTQQELIHEEQKILDDLIRKMDNAMLQLNKRMSRAELNRRKAESRCLPEAYGDLVAAERTKASIRDQKYELRRAREALYTRRIVLDTEEHTSFNGHDGDVYHDQLELKIGTHTYENEGNVYIVSWVRPVCRHYLMDNSAVEFDGIVKGIRGDNHMHCVLKLKRDVDMFFDTIRSVTHLYPELEEAEKVLADAFLQELLNRRSEQEFRNIIFSIQKQQGEIIQTPFRQNLIVQGCAGSGKSMIMLHRLPVLLYDNPDTLERNGLYIITPSMAYIQMAENMRRDLEIEDLKMGTLQQYYDHLIEKYGRHPEEYGRVRAYSSVPEDIQKYVYSKECIEDIKIFIKGELLRDRADTEKGFQILGIQKKPYSSGTLSEQITAEVNSIQEILDENRKRLWQIHRDLRTFHSEVNRLANALAYRQTAILNSLERNISGIRRELKQNKADLERVRIEEGPVSYVNLRNSIEAAEKRIPMLQAMKKIVEGDKTCFDKLLDVSRQLRFLLNEITIEEEAEKMALSEQYRLLGKAKAFFGDFKAVMTSLEDSQDDYWMYDNTLEPRIESAQKAAEKMLKQEGDLLPLEYAEGLTESAKRRNQLRMNMIRKTYLHQLHRLSLLEEDNAVKVFGFSSYLYLQILKCFYGAPNAAKERLITIDEAQNVAPEELRLIKTLNGNSVIFNLFGDVKQHIEGTKGIDKWEDISDIAVFSRRDMRENYRNARQITEYCNQKFGMKMRAINLDGAGVHDFSSKYDYKEQLISVFRKPQRMGLSAMIVKTREEALSVMAALPEFTSRFHDLTGEPDEIHRTRWNLMTIDQVKGLEFETVIVLSGRMTRNEQYIAYTRALNELYVYEREIPLLKTEQNNADTKPGNIGLVDAAGGESRSSQEDGAGTEGVTPALRKRTSRKNRSESARKPDISVADFFRSKGLEVLDLRRQTGFLWVIGERHEIEPIINQAMEAYGISGTFGCGKSSRFRPGWYTKTKM